jgi:hypothetical protein
MKNYRTAIGFFAAAAMIAAILAALTTWTSVDKPKPVTHNQRALSALHAHIRLTGFRAIRRGCRRRDKAHTYSAQITFAQFGH